MPVRSVDRRRAQLDASFGKVRLINDLELRADFARYLCVLVSGFMEQSVRDILIEHATARAAPTVARYVEGSVGRRNLKTERLLQIVGSFSADWRKELEEYVNGERKDALDSVVANRNLIAHGEWTSISYHQLTEYYRNVKEIIVRLDTMCLA